MVLALLYSLQSTLGGVGYSLQSTLGGVGYIQSLEISLTTQHLVVLVKLQLRTEEFLGGRQWTSLGSGS